MFDSSATPISPVSPVRPWISRILIWGIDILYLLAVLSIFLLAGHVTDTVAQRLRLSHQSPYAVLLTVLDPILLLMMLAELLHTIGSAVETHRIPHRQLMALLWMALLRHAVVMTQTAPSLATPNAAATLAGLIVLGIWLGRWMPCGKESHIAPSDPPSRPAGKPDVCIGEEPTNHA